MADGLGSTGHPVVDALQGIQLIADTYDHLDEKLAYIRLSIEKITGIGSCSLFGSGVYVTTCGLWLKEPEPNLALRYYGDQFTLRAEVIGPTYMYDPDIPVDNLALKLRTIQPISVSPEHEAPLLERSCNAAVLSIMACRSVMAN